MLESVYLPTAQKQLLYNNIKKYKCTSIVFKNQDNITEDMYMMTNEDER